MEFPKKFDTVRPGWPAVIIEGSHIKLSKKKTIMDISYSQLNSTQLYFLRIHKVLNEIEQ